jgi:hypothetical protein
MDTDQQLLDLMDPAEYLLRCQQDVYVAPVPRLTPSR